LLFAGCSMLVQGWLELALYRLSALHARKGQRVRMMDRHFQSVDAAVGMHRWVLGSDGQGLAGCVELRRST